MLFKIKLSFSSRFLIISPTVTRQTRMLLKFNCYISSNSLISPAMTTVASNVKRLSETVNFYACYMSIFYQQICHFAFQASKSAPPLTTARNAFRSARCSVALLLHGGWAGWHRCDPAAIFRLLYNVFYCFWHTFFRKVVPLFDCSIWKSKFFISINFLAFFLWPLVSLLLKTSNSSTAQISLGSRTVERALSGRYVNHMKPFSDLPLGEREKLGLHSTATYSGLLLNGPITPEN